jgi:predicted AAA+ superfamily ATPase
MGKVMHRKLLDRLLVWKGQDTRKPLLIDGARQTGKTYLLTELLGKKFRNVLHVDFLEDPTMKEAFEGALTPSEIISNLQLLTNQQFSMDTDLLILDEIGECQNAINSLKFFAEKAPTMFVAASGSNIGLLTSFPVGKVEEFKLYPLSFEEFLIASEQNLLLDAYYAQTDNKVTEKRFMDALTDYYFVGGMPESVWRWFKDPNENILKRVDAVRAVQNNLVSGYTKNFGKYSGKVSATLIESVFKNIPNQLSQNLDDSVKRYRFKGIDEKKSRYGDFDNSINWLEKCHLALKNYLLEGAPRTPFMAYKTDNTIKLFCFDVGILNAMLQTDYNAVKKNRFEYKGFIAENFVQQELVVMGNYPTFSWRSGRTAELEFMIKDMHGNVIPIEVKSGKRTKAKSLQSYKSQYNPVKTIKLIGGQGSSPLEKSHLVIPLYFTGHLMERVNA